MTTEPILLKLAKQGDARAIAALINAALTAQEIRAKAKLDGECLQVMLKSPHLLNQQISVAFLRRGMLRLQAESINSVRAYAWQSNREFPTWVVEFPVNQISASPSRLEAASLLSSPDLAAVKPPVPIAAVLETIASNLAQDRPEPMQKPVLEVGPVEVASPAIAAPLPTSASPAAVKQPVVKSKPQFELFKLGFVVVIFVMAYFVVVGV